MDIDLLELDALAAPPVGEGTEHEGGCGDEGKHGTDNGGDGIESSKALPRPAVLDSLEPISPAEQRAALPKKKRQPKSKAKSKAKSSRKKGDKDDVDDSKADSSHSLTPTEKPKSRTSKGPAKTAKSSEGSDKASKAKDSEEKSTKKRSRKKVDQQEVEPVEPKDAKKKRKAKTSDQTKAPERKRKVKTAAAESGAVASALGGTEAAPAVDPATERKKRLSRRSSAYHVAKKRALAAGKSAEEATALAKEVAGPNQKKVMSQIGSVQNRIKFGIHPILRYF